MGLLIQHFIFIVVVVVVGGGGVFVVMRVVFVSFLRSLYLL